ncbi:hypothetical protein EVAR_59456_1 [Eumeta japonica]|uniref:Uncharacterized protein n=1 Tax=Eumeta variegata TaxID=151549 RepID=A0A4C1ZV44_EUMVA|nr:hypothetical protein EVAR_59456_1 [Eumeta japonica]
MINKKNTRWGPRRRRVEGGEMRRRERDGDRRAVARPARAVANKKALEYKNQYRGPRAQRMGRETSQSPRSRAYRFNVLPIQNQPQVPTLSGDGEPYGVEVALESMQLRCDFCVPETQMLEQRRQRVVWFDSKRYGD